MTTKNTITARLYLVLLLVFIFAALTGKVTAQSVNSEVVAGGMEDAAQVDGLVKVSRVISDRFGESCLVNRQPYFGLDGQQSGNSFEFFVPSLNESVSAICNDSQGVVSLWIGVPMHSDPERLSKARESVLNKFGLEVGDPEWICWNGGLDVWAVYSEADLQSADHIACNLFNFRSTTYGEIDQQGAAGKLAKRAHRKGVKAAASLITLQNNVPVTNLSGSKYSEAHYKIAVPAGVTKLDITITGGTGDCDLYVKQGQQASTTIYDYRPFLNGNNEAVSVNNPASGDWYVMLRGYKSYYGVTLQAAYTGNSSYVLLVTPEKVEYLPGEKAVFIGSLKTSSGQAVSNYRIGVDDSIELLCKLGPYTDSSGNFRYESTTSSSSAGVYGITFYGGSSKAFCVVHVKGSFGFQVSNPDHIVRLGATLNTSDIDFAYTGKIGNGLRQSTPQELLDADKKISTFMAGAGKAALIDFVSNPLNDVAALSSGACMVGVWTGFGTIPCVTVYRWTLKSAAKSLVYGVIAQSIEMSDLSADQKLYWKEVAKPGVKCVMGIGFLDPSSVTAEISAGVTGWKCGQTIVKILSNNNQDVLAIAAVPSYESQSKASMLVTLVPLQESQFPNITSVSPASGVAGISVTINGNKFGATQGTGTVKFGAAAATVTSWSDTKIVATTPPGSGNIYVTVTTTAGTSNGIPFTYIVTATTISSISPTSGTAGTSVTINGSGFGATQGASAVKFGSTAATVTSWSDTNIVATAPTGSGTVYVTVTTTAGTSNGVQFTYIVATPTITSISPTSGTVGTSVTINGSRFGTTQGASTVKFGSTAASVTSWSDTKIIATTPPGNGIVNVTVTTTAGTSNGIPFTYILAAPTISSISPTSGTAGTSVTINGSGFGATQGASTVKFGSATATVTSWSDTKIIATAPSGNGTANVTVTTTAGTSNGVPFTYKTAMSERITNGSFSSGSSGWTLGGDFWAGTNLTNYRTAPGYAAGGVSTGGIPKNNANGYMCQTVTIPSNATSATLSFWYFITSEEVSGYYDTLNVRIENTSGNYLATVAVLGNSNKGTSYSQKTFNATPYKGQTIRINFVATTDFSNTTVFRIDDVSLMSDGN